MIIADVMIHECAVVMTSSPGLTFERGHGEIERIGAVGAGHAVPDVHGGGEFPLERIDIGSADERVVADHGGDRAVDLALDGLILKLQIGEGYRHPSIFLIRATAAGAPDCPHRCRRS